MGVSNTCKISAVRARFARAFPRRAVCRNEFSRAHAHFADFVYLQAFGKHYVFLEKQCFFLFLSALELENWEDFVSRHILLCMHFARGGNMRKLYFVTFGFAQNRACQFCWGGARVSPVHFACAFRARQ